MGRGWVREEAALQAEGTVSENITCSGSQKEIRVTRCRLGVGAEDIGRRWVIKVFLCHCFSNSSHEIDLIGYNQHF